MPARRRRCRACATCLKSRRWDADMFTAGGVVVVADSTWAAMKGRDALQITWDHGAAASESSEGDAARPCAPRRRKPGKRVRNDGDVDAALSNGAKKVEAVYEMPLLAHATMEPMNITVHVRGSDAEVWAPTQSPDWVQGTVAQVLGLKPDKVIVHTTLMGGGFGRRYMADYPAEVAQIAKVVGKPVQLVWTREDDMTHDFYRPATCHRMQGAVDAAGASGGVVSHVGVDVDSRRIGIRQAGARGVGSGRRGANAVRDSECAAGVQRRGQCGAARVVAVGRAFVQRICGGEFHRRTGGRGRAGSGAVPQVVCW